MKIFLSLCYVDWRFVVVSGIIFTLLSFTVVGSRAQIMDGRPISSLPYFITNSGHYHLTRNFNQYSAGRVAIRVLINDGSNDVVLDLNDHTITSTQTNQLNCGIQVAHNGSGFARITVRNGTFRGFVTGVSLSGTAVLVENLTIIGVGDYTNTVGIAVGGGYGTVRNNRVINQKYGLLLGGSGLSVKNNDVSDCDVGVALGFNEPSYNPVLRCPGAIAEGNRITGGSRAIQIINSDNVLIVNSHITGSTEGIYFYSADTGFGATGKYRDNLTVGVTTPYTGGTDAGNNQ